MEYKLGVDVGGTFTDVLLIETDSGTIHTAKVPSTPEDSSIGVLNGIARVCELAGADPTDITHVTHGTTVATNAVLTGRGARVGLITTRGYRQVLQIARSFVPGGLGGWVVYDKSEPMAPLECTREVPERIGADGAVVEPLDEAATRAALEALAAQGIEALTVCLINSFTNGDHERRIAELAAEVMPDVPVSISCEVIPEMQEYERTITTVANSYVRPEVSKYIDNLQRELDRRMNGTRLSILRSDGGLSTAAAAARFPVNLLMSGPAGGVSGALWIGEQAGFQNLLTFDMGGTSTDVSLIENGQALVRRETTVGDVNVRASSVDVRTVGAGGGSVAYVPELTGALRVGPESAGAVPGPAAYDKGGTQPTVTDANVVLGYLPATAKLGGDMAIRRDLAEQAVAQVADAMGLPLMEAAEGIVKIVNENMFGALRLVSVEKGYDPRDFALIAFGGAGPLHANALGRLTGAWPVIIPPGPGVLCAYGDATTRLRAEASRTFISKLDAMAPDTIVGELDALDRSARDAMLAEQSGREGAGLDDDQISSQYQVDLRYSGQGLVLTIDTSAGELREAGFARVAERFDALHEQLFTFALDAEKEFVNLRSVVQGPPANVQARAMNAASGSVEDAVVADHTLYADGAEHPAKIYDRAKLAPGHVVPGPAVVTEMDSTTLILPGHQAEVDKVGNLLIRPED
ncbi:MAG: 5-oxoprolinase [Gammaproteobacteria bacterium]|nr:5-oxoprolinase [Gammaproteobacteria bacterium]MBK81410.1 5-oxoprolinase [Gammaproteobacteria bacterium]|tara:strand:- start:2046 stop:4121 length:2076 start_codon:yes stop_codon:yes gene_type:complete